MLNKAFSDFVMDKVAETLVITEDSNHEWKAKNQEVNKIYSHIRSLIGNENRELLGDLCTANAQLGEIACANCYLQGFKDAIKLLSGI